MENTNKKSVVVEDLVLNQTLNEIDENIKIYNDGFIKKDLSVMEEALAKLKELETDYAKFKENKVFKELSTVDNPVKAAILMMEYPVVKHRKVMADGVEQGIERVEKTVGVNLVKLCDRCGISTDWKHKIEKFNQLMTLKTAIEEGCKPEDVRKIQKSFYMSEQARRVEMGETPYSNTQLCKMMQSIFDEILFEDNGQGKNKYKVCTRDVKHMMNCFTKKGRKAKSVETAKTGDLIKLFVEMANRIIKNDFYTVVCKLNKDA